MARTYCRLLSALIVAACVSGGCESDNAQDPERRDRDTTRRDRLERRERRERREGGGGREGRDRLGDRYDDRPDQVIGRGSDRLGRDSDRLAGGSRDLPSTATRVDEGDGQRLTYSPTRDGTLYVYDADDGRVVYSGRVLENERFTLDPAAGRATLDGRTVLGADLNSRHRYRLYFDRARRD